uniref:Gustatory receptor n=1 Tax=Adelphocoris lineolatus TaxID=236346 RepID=A0A2I4PH97_ADELI|nr:gustatory receptor 3 [Adelphocoris lineolatus]
MRPVLLVSQFIGVFPICGVLGSDHTQLKYSKFSFKSLVSMTVMTATSVLAATTTLLVIREGLTYKAAGDIVYTLANASSMIAFYNLAKRWKSLMGKWAAVEDSMAGLPTVNVSRSIQILTAYVVCASMCEHTMAILYNRSPCIISLETYYKECFRHVFSFTKYALWKGILASLLGFYMVSAWNFTDLFLMTLSIALSSRFKQFNLELESIMHLDMDAKYWMKMRGIYNKLALLTKLVDANVSTLIWISFINNLFFVCLQLLHTTDPFQSIPKMIYSIISFSHLVFRACAVCMTAADVYHSSKAPMAILFSVPSSSYNIEVQRMTLQVSMENLSLSGCRFFFITRTLMLTVAGTIATYEIVLLQFRNISPDFSETTAINCTGLYSDDIYE